MAHMVLTVDAFIELIQKIKKEEKIKYVYWNNNLSGTCSAPSKKVDHYRIGYAIAPDIFNEKIRDKMLGQIALGKVMHMSLLFLDDKNINKEIVQKEKKEKKKDVRKKRK